MIAADTSAWIDYSKAVDSKGARLLEDALSSGALVIPHPVIFEVLSGPGLTKEAEEALRELPRLEISDGFWERAGKARNQLLQGGSKARAMDCLIAQNCIDHNVMLIASDSDFKHFKRFGLKLA